MIELGEKYEDKVTGFKGVATARTEYMNGCVRIMIEAPMNKDGKLEEFWFDEQRVDPESDVKTGGPGSTPTSRDPVQ